MSNKRFVKGLFKDTGHIDQPEGSWRYALNAFINDKEGSISNEGGTHTDGRLPLIPVPGIGQVEHYLVLGSIEVDDDRVVLFLRDQRDNTAANTFRSAIAIWKPGAVTGNGFFDGVQLLYDDSVLIDEGRKPLNFNKSYPIEGTFKIDSSQDLIVYFTDDLNPPRAFNVTRQQTSIDNGNPRTWIYGIDPTVATGTTHFDHVDLLNLFPNSGPVPHIDFFTIYDNVSTLDDGDQSSVTTGGGLLTGVYYLALAYIDEDFVSTNFVTVSNPVSIVTEYDHTRPTFRKDGNKSGSQTSKAINWKVSNLNTDYKYLKAVVIRKMGDAVDAFRLNDIDLEIANTSGVVFSGIEGFTKSSVDDVIIDMISYETAKTINQLDGVLFLGNVTGSKDLGYQKYANNIKLHAITKEIENFDEFWATTDNLETGFQDFPVDNGNYVDDSKSYRFQTNIFKYKGYQRDEVYAFYIAFILNDGSMSYAYHIPGRSDLGTERNLVTDHSNPNVAVLGDVSKQQAREFHFLDTSAQAGSNNMNYWENATEFYPNTDNFEMWDQGGPFSNIKGAPVRHHHFPSNENNDFKTIHGNNIETSPSAGTSAVLPIISGRIVMGHLNGGEVYYNANYSSARGNYFPIQLPSTTVPQSVVNDLISHVPNTSGNCSNGGGGMRTVLTANQPMTVTTHYHVMSNRACSNTGGKPTSTRVNSNSSLTTMTGTEYQQDEINSWSVCADSNYNSSRHKTGTSVIQLMPGEQIWIESSSTAADRARQGRNTDNGYYCFDMAAAFINFGQYVNFDPNPSWVNGSVVVFSIQSGAVALSADDPLDAKISHDVKRLGFKLSDIKIPKSIGDKIQGFRVYYAKRDHANKTILGQSTLNPMKLRTEFMGRCSEVVANGGADGIQNMAQLQSLPEIFWSKDAWPGNKWTYPEYLMPYKDTPIFVRDHGYKAFSFHDFTLLRTQNSIAAATHIKTQYTVRNLAWNGPGLEQDRKMLNQISNAGVGSGSPLEIKEYWGWDEPGDEQNCYAREIHGAIFIGGTYYNHNEGSWLYERPRLLGQKAKLYLNGDSIFKGQHLGFGGKIFNEFGESSLVFGLRDGHEIAACNFREDNLSSPDLSTHFGVHHAGGPAILVNPLFDYAIHQDYPQALRAVQYLINLHAFKTDVYKSIDTQPLVWTGFEVLGSDLENYVFDDDTGNPTYGTATWKTEDTHPEGIWGGDTFICRYGYVSSLTPNNESERSNPKKAIYYHIVESQDNINFRHFESDLSLYFPGSPAKTLLKYAGSTFNEGTIYDFTKQDEIKYNDNYSEVNDLRTAFPLPVRIDQITDFPTRAHRSTKADTTRLQDNWRIFLANQYRDLPKNRGELWKLSSFNNLLYFHMEESLFAAKGKQSLQMKDGSESFVGSGDIFEQEPDEVVQSETGYGGTQSQWAALTTRNGYFFVDVMNRKVFLMRENLSEISNLGMESWFRNNLKFELENYNLSTSCIKSIMDNPIIGFGLHAVYDPKFKRIILTKRDLIPTTYFKNKWELNSTLPIPNGAIRYNVNKCIYQQYLMTIGSGGTWVDIDWGDSTMFCKGGWTISFHPELNVWASFHSYIPYHYFTTSKDFYSMTDKYLEYVNGTTSNAGTHSFQNTLGVNYGNALIWKHNEYIKGALYQNIGVQIQTLPSFTRYPFEFEFIHNETRNESKTYSNFAYTLDAYKYDSTTNYHDVYILDHGFTDYIIYNTNQIFTTSLALAGTPATALEYFINIRRIGNEWKLNGFRDFSNITNNTNNYYMSTNTNVISGTNTGTHTTSHTNSLFDVNSGCPYYQENLNTNYLNLNKPWNERRKFVDKWAGFRLIYNNYENILLNLYSTQVGTRKHYR